jgi:FlaG/FlaF family flagellin (archaellin)
VAYGLHANFNTGQGIMAAYDYDVVSKFFGINSVGDYGLANMMIGGAKSVAEFAGGAIVGIGEGAWGTVKGLGTFAWGLVSNSPIENGRKAWATVKSVGSAVYNYDKTWSAITTSVSKGWTEFVNADAYGKGKTVGHVLEGIGETFVGGAVVNKLRKVSQASLPVIAVVESKAPKVLFRGGNKFELSAADIKSSADKLNPNITSGKKGLSVNTNHLDPNVQKYGGAFEIDLKTVPKELEFRLTKGTHYEIVPPKGITIDQFQGLLDQIQVKNYNTWPKK